MKLYGIKINMVKKITSLLIVIAPILEVYTGFSPFLVLPETIFLTLMPLYLLYFQKNTVIIESRCNILVLYCFLLNVLSLVTYFYQPSFSLYKYLAAATRFNFYVFLIILIVPNFFVFEYAAKWYLRMAIIASIYLIIQSLAYNFCNLMLPCYTKLIPLYAERNTDYASIYSLFFRASSFFLEPSMFAHYVLPMLALVLFYQYKGKRNILPALLMTIAILLSTSGTGIMLSFIIWSVWGYQYIKCRDIGNLFLRIIIMSIIVLFVILPVFNTELMKMSLDRLFGENDTASSNIRIVRGFAVYSMLPLQYKIFGFGYGNYSTYVSENNITTRYDQVDSSYTNAAAFILTGTGIIGFITLLAQLLMLFVKTTGFFKMRVLILLVTLFFSADFLLISTVTAFAFILPGLNRAKQQCWKQLKTIERVNLVKC